jgi:DNA-binding protein H-NS
MNIAYVGRSKHLRESAMRKPELHAMEFDELWLIHEEITRILAEKMVVEKRELETRLAKLNRAEKIRDERSSPQSPKLNPAPRRKYPKVLAKYFNPLSPSETWSGRGKQPRWLVAAIEAGHQLDEFKISNLDKTTVKKGLARN